MIKEIKAGVFAYCVDAYVTDHDESKRRSEPKVGTLALLCSDMKVVANRGHSTHIAQFYGLVIPGMIMARHVFAGLQRPLLTDGNNGADGEKMAYSWKPSFDHIWEGSGYDGGLRQVDAPKSAVFSVLVSPNKKHRADYPEVDGWINHWTWIDEDPVLPEAPIGWVDRYDIKLWTRK